MKERSQMTEGLRCPAISESLLASCRRVRQFLPFLSITLPLLLGQASAADNRGGAGDLLVAPTRLVFEARQRTAEVTLVNVGSRAATYRISFVHIRMAEDGGTREIETPEAGEQFADDLIRYSPRQVTLEPNVAQTVRMQLRKPADLAPGEYRSHLLFRAIPDATPVETTSEPSKELNIRLRPIYGVSIPVIVRHGETSAQVSLSDLEIVRAADEKDGSVIRFRIHRTGNRSVHGNFTVTFTPAGGKPTVVGVANGVAVYTPNPTRLFWIALHPPQNVLLGKGVFHVSYSKPDKADDTIAEAELRVP